MMESKGFEIIDLGVDVPPEKYVDYFKKHNTTLLVEDPAAMALDAI